MEPPEREDPQVTDPIPEAFPVVPERREPSAGSTEHPRSSAARLIVIGVLGAVVSSALASALALQLAKPDIPAEALALPSSSAPAAPPDEVIGLAGKLGTWTADPASWQVELSWTAPSEEADRFAVRRDGELLQKTNEPSFLDRDVVPEERYVYEVLALAAGRPSKPVDITVRTDPLRLNQARLDGRWVLRFSVISSTVGAGDHGRVMVLEPSCEVGPCDARWSFPGVGNTGVADATGVTARGTGTGSFFTLDCHGSAVASTTVTIDLTMLTAHVVDGAWRATKIEGTLTESVPSVSNCLSARNVWSFKGEVQG